MHHLELCRRVSHVLGTLQAYKQDKIHAAMEEANAKLGVKAVPAALETSAGAPPAVGSTSKGGMVVGDVHSYRSRTGMLSLREALVDVLLPIIVLLIGVRHFLSFSNGHAPVHHRAAHWCAVLYTLKNNFHGRAPAHHCAAHWCALGPTRAACAVLPFARWAAASVWQARAVWPSVQCYEAYPHDMG